MTRPNEPIGYDLEGNPIVGTDETTMPDQPTDPVPDQPLGGALDTEWDGDTWTTLHETLPEEVEDLSTLTGALEQYAEGVHRLYGLYHTVQQEGVSRDDMRTLQALQTTLLPQDLQVGLEAFNPQHFTQTRTTVMMTVSKESFAQTLVRTIKAWIDRLVDFIGRCIEWVVKNLVGEAKYTRALERRTASYERARKAHVDLQRLVGNYDLTSIMDAYGQTLLNDDAVIPNEAFAIAMGTTTLVRKLETARTQLVKETKAVAGEIDRLKSDLEKASGAIGASQRPLARITYLRQTFDEIVAPSNTIQRALTTYSGQFNQPPSKATQVVTPFEDIVAEYHVMRRRLKDIKKINRETHLPEVMAFMNDVSTAVTNLSVIINALKMVNDTKLQVMGMYINYENHYLNQLYQKLKSEQRQDGMKMAERILSDLKTSMNSI